MLGNNFGKYTFVVGAKETSTNIELVEKIKDEVGRRTGAYIDIEKDSTPKYEYEIVFGNTNRQASALLYEDEKYKGDLYEFSLESSGNSLAVGFGSKIALCCVTDEIMELVKTDQKSVSTRFSAKDTQLLAFPLEKSKGAEMRVATSNVLFSTEAYAKVSAKLRMELLAEYYIALDCDVVGLQECFYDNLKFINGGVSERFAFVPKIERHVHQPESIIYRHDRYTLEDFGLISLNYDNMPTNRNLYQFTWVVLKNIVNGNIYIQGNLHYHYYSEADRLIQTKMVNAELKKLLAAYPDAMLAVSGDYNSTIDSKVHNDMIAGTELTNAIRVTPNSMVELEEFDDKLIDHFIVNPNTTKVYLCKRVSNSLLKIASDHYPVIIDVSGKNTEK